MASLDQDLLQDLDSGTDDGVEYAEEDGSEGKSNGAAQESSISKRTGLANAMTRILSQDVGEKKVPILAKVKLKQDQKAHKQQEDSPSPKKRKVVDEASVENVKLTKKRSQKKGIGHVRPDVTMLAKERQLVKIATRGAVQLFNTVKKQQKTIESKLKDAGSSEQKKSKVLSSVDKRSFVDMLKGQKTPTTTTDSGGDTGAATSGGKPAKQKQRPTLLEEGEPSSKWSILRSDFMLGASMKDWDRQSEDDEEEEEQ